MNREKIYFILILVINLSALIIGYISWVYGVGFPDGYISEYSERMLLVFGYCKYGIIAATALALYLCYVSKSKSVISVLKWVFGVSLAIAIFMGSYHVYAICFLDSGQGG